MIRSFAFGGVLLICFMFLPLAFARETLPLAAQPSPSPVKYELPYPGILPDNLLFPLKQLRDQILLVLITAPIKKVEFYILLADKQAGMSQALMAKQKPDLAVTTIGKSYAYLEAAEHLLFTIPNGNAAPVANTKFRLEQSISKQIEVLMIIKSSVPAPLQEKVNGEKQMMEALLTDFRSRK